MIHFLANILLILVITEFVVGTVVNSFTVLVYCVDWVKSQEIYQVDEILTTLALFRIRRVKGVIAIMLLGSLTLLLSLQCPAPDDNISEIPPASYSLLDEKSTQKSALSPIPHGHYISLILNPRNYLIWFAVSLSIFYLLKIANFSNLVFLYLKWRVIKVLLILILGSLPFLISQFTVISMHDNMRHLKKMQLSGKRARDPSSQVHRRTLQQTVISFLLLFACYFLVLMISVWSSKREPKKLIFIFCLAVGILYPSGHTFVLIWENKKLKESFLTFLWQLRIKQDEQINCDKYTSSKTLLMK
ncbi:putative taste receptor type 2 member 33 [Erinaceus europaeus]|uniref:Taste receptor type 2 n=1 Tax=Erinaceus europaeus TaxID=9365 RepID=A0ABM3XL14_ERIEU|nr:putative taste receptor type 2 member 33 [Erinaceus europaeus]